MQNKDKNAAEKILCPSVFICKIPKETPTETLNYIFNFLSDNEKKRVLQKRTKKSFSSAVFGIILAKHATKSLYNLSFANQSFSYTKKGKPFFENQNLYFSISHSGDYVACTTAKKPVGIDIQKIHPFSERLAKRICNSLEYESISKSENKSSNLTKLWSQKEAAAKQTGEGIFASDFKNCLNGKTCFSKKICDYWISICI